MEENIKLRLKELYKTGILLAEGKSDTDLENDFIEKRPVQLTLLEECLKFTEAAFEKNLQNSMQSLVTSLNEQIEYISKETREIHKILLLILLRSWAEKLSSCQPGSYDWEKIPQFARKGGMMDPKITILGHEYSYGFHFL